MPSERSVRFSEGGSLSLRLEVSPERTSSLWYRSIQKTVPPAIRSLPRRGLVGPHTAVDSWYHPMGSRFQNEPYQTICSWAPTVHRNIAVPDRRPSRHASHVLTTIKVAVSVHRLELVYRREKIVYHQRPEWDLGFERLKIHWAPSR